MKKALCILLITCLLFSLTVPYTFADDSGRVEISFRVGENVLKINGKDVPVETPYVVGEGVTLVPLRVITEAFGATVGWDNATQTVSLDYPGINILLQIGNPVAEVNGKTETLLAAPELPNSSTMVPLRFISETFGATVSYDEATEAILVVKEDSTPADKPLLGAVDAMYIGDSYYGWSMENPKDLTMSERRFDGLYTEFTADEDAVITLTIAFRPDDYNFNQDFSAAKASISNYTLVKADRFPSTESMHLQGRDKTGFIDIYAYATENYVFTLISILSNENPELLEKCLQITSTFTPDFYAVEKAHDLSSANGDWRTFENTDYKISMQIPAEYILLADSDIENEFTFIKPNTDATLTGMKFGVYSRSKDLTAHLLAVKDLERFHKILNEEIATISAISQRQYGNYATYEFAINVKKSHSSDCFAKNYYWEVGDYVYTLNIELSTPFEGDTYAYADSIMESVKAEPIDAQKIGILLRNDPETMGTFISTPKNNVWSMTVPNTYAPNDVPGEDGAIYSHKISPTMVVYDINTYDAVSGIQVSNALSTTEKKLKETKNAVITIKADQKRIGSKYYNYDELYYIEDGEKIYIRRYVFVAHGTQTHQFSVYMHELNHSQGIIEEVENMISTLTIK